MESGFWRVGADADVNEAEGAAAEDQGVALVDNGICADRGGINKVFCSTRIVANIGVAYAVSVTTPGASADEGIGPSHRISLAGTGSKEGVEVGGVVKPGKGSEEGVFYTREVGAAG